VEELRERYARGERTLVDLSTDAIGNLEIA
jgi:hypothetical protein